MTRGPRSQDGFTLIEVVGSLLIFTVGVLMTLNLTDSMGRQLERAAIRSELVTVARSRLDSLEAAPFAGLSTGSEQSTLSIRGKSYRERVVISSFSPLVLQIQVTVEPVTGDGPEETLTSYVSERW